MDRWEDGRMDISSYNFQSQSSINKALMPELKVLMFCFKRFSLQLYMLFYPVSFPNLQVMKPN